MVVTTDASNLVWGGYCSSQTFKGTWLPHKKRFHINWKELKAVQLTLLRLGHQALQGKCVPVRTDNTTTIAYINRQGGTRSSTHCALAIRLHLWSLAHKIALKANYLQGKLNVLADALTRNILSQTEWSLHERTVNRLRCWEPSLQIDLFASSKNHCLPLFFSLEKGGAHFADALLED
jgi:hypothetical protein